MLQTGPVKRRRGAIGEERRWEGLSLGLIGNASGKNSDKEVELDPRRFR